VAFGEFDRIRVEGILKHADSSDGPADVKLGVLIDDSDAGGVIPPVFQAFEPLNE
jgi:hypothetical protein